MWEYTEYSSVALLINIDGDIMVNPSHIEGLRPTKKGCVLTMTSGKSYELRSSVIDVVEKISKQVSNKKDGDS